MIILIVGLLDSCLEFTLFIGKFGVNGVTRKLINIQLLYEMRLYEKLSDQDF
jgi:hypothetical protein